MITERLRAKFFERIRKNESSGCWEWTAAHLPSGYGTFTHRESGQAQTVRAHRLSWEIHRGPIPSRMWVLHKCDNKPCVNPAHLFLGTRSDNALDAVAKGKHYTAARTHCPQGHPYTPENILPNKRGYRGCRTCRNIASKAYHRRMRAIDSARGAK